MTLAEFIELNKNNGSYFFSDDTMKFFNSKIHNWDSSGLFITSEKPIVGNERRKYTIRQGDLETGDVASVGDFQSISTLKAARLKFKKLVHIENL